MHHADALEAAVAQQPPQPRRREVLQMPRQFQPPPVRPQDRPPRRGEVRDADVQLTAGPQGGECGLAELPRVRHVFEHHPAEDGVHGLRRRRVGGEGAERCPEAAGPARLDGRGDEVDAADVPPGVAEPCQEVPPPAADFKRHAAVPRRQHLRVLLAQPAVQRLQTQDGPGRRVPGPADRLLGSRLRDGGRVTAVVRGVAVGETLVRRAGVHVAVPAAPAADHAERAGHAVQDVFAADHLRRVVPPAQGAGGLDHPQAARPGHPQCTARGSMPRRRESQSRSAYAGSVSSTANTSLNTYTAAIIVSNCGQTGSPSVSGRTPA